MQRRRSDGSNAPAAAPLPAAPIGPYRVLETLGSGTMGAVYRAQHMQSRRQVALKTIVTAAEGLLPAMRREVRALSQLRHPGIVTLLETGRARGWPWYAMELVEGPTLRELRSSWVRQRPPLSEVLSLARKLCEPLAYLHGEGLVHRDLKPQNVILRGGSMPVLVDFGLSARVACASGRALLEQQHTGIGTLAYMSPEALRGELLDARADLYALGCILYELLCGAPPFASKKVNDVIAGHLEGTPRPPSEHVPALPPALDELVLGLLHKQPRARIGYAADVAAALEALGAVPAHYVGAPAARPYLHRAGCVGRDGLRAEVVATVGQRFERDEGVAIVLSGEAGMGKTRLAMAICSELERDGALVLMGQCVEDGPPLGGFAGPLQQIAERCRAKGRAHSERWLGRRADVLARYHPALRPLSRDAGVPPDESTQRARQRLLDALGDTLAAMARDQPVLVVLDDLQWADELTLASLTQLVSSPLLDHHPLAILGAWRASGTDARLASLSRHARCLRVSVPRLDEAAIGELVQQMLGLSGSPPALAGELARLSQGNPFFASAYLRAALAEGLLRRDAHGRWQLSGAEDEAPRLRAIEQRVREGLARGSADASRSP